MNYQDNKRVQTAEELRKMFNLDNLSKDRRAIANNKSGLTRIEAEQSNILKSLIINLGDSIEDQSEISLWFFNGIPTLSNVPTIEWEDKSEHVGDFYYDKDTGYAYKFIFEEDTYLWEQQSDSNLIQALALTNAELDTVDGSRRVFFTTPSPPYDNGDWYVDENSDLYICQISKPSTEQYDVNDFIIASKYTDDTKAMEVAGKLTIVSGQVTTIIKNLDLISQTIEDNRYYIDETGNKILITEKMSQVVQTVNKLESEISEAADITISADGYGSVNLSRINESEPIYLRIYPTNNNDISFLYPRDNLYPSDDLFFKGRTIRFATDDYYVDYELPDDLLYYDENNYDEFILDYGAQSCLVNKRVAYNADGSKRLLDSPQTLVYKYPTIHLNTGDYTVTMLGYEDAYIFVRMMTQSLYTDQFATKMELNSSITQTSKSINASVDEKLNLVNGDIKQLSADVDIQSDKIEAKLDSNDFTSAAVIGLINNRDGTSTAKINATNINLTGYITATDLKTSGATTINGSNIVTGTIDANKVTVTNLSASNIKSGTMTADRISGGTIDASKVNVINIKADNIISGTIDASKVTVKNLNASNITSGTISTSRLSTDVITTSNFSAQKINADNITAGTLTGRAISGGSITGSTINGGSINIDKSGYYFNMGLSTNHPNCSGLNVGWGGVNVNGLGLNSDGYTFTLAGGISTPYVNVNNALRTWHIEGSNNSAITIHAGGNDGSYANNGGIYMATGQVSGTPSHITLNAQSGYGFVYAEGNGTPRGRVAIDSSGPSSRCLKDNITDYTNKEYEEALDLLKYIEVYNYNYKYNIHPKNNQYGFIIDDLLDNELAKKFLYFKDEVAGVMKDGRLDYSANEEENSNNLPIIHFKRYDEETLIKFILVCCKSLQNKIERLEEQLNVN